MHLELKGGAGKGAYLVQDFITILCQYILLFSLLILLRTTLILRKFLLELILIHQVIAYTSAYSTFIAT
jgi:hypothetical protein